MIQLFNVTKVYSNGVKALNDVSLTINKGDFVFIVGPSGAGKSTFMKLLYREEKPDRGQILIKGKSIVRMKDKEVPLLRRSIGVIFQDFKLLSDRTVYENVAFAMEVVESSKEEVERRVPKVLETVGLKGKEYRYPGQLSGGEQQRVAVARAIVNNPDLLIADEPTGNLDPDNSWEIMDLLVKVNKRGTTVVMATHAKEIVDMMKKRVIAIEKGKVVRDQERGRYGYEN
ncbi:cell division transport system ATP-binding protein [Desulfitispora alkaliphila]|uniref:cell division ATP-binding protein FtsE n=1 Tax=Desulfitispora alkaliphila TaxID=622674 RepID=UPI003D1C8192